MNIGERIKQIRKENGLTQERLASSIGIKQNSLAVIEIGKRNPSDAVIIAICNRLGANERWLRTGEGEACAIKNNSLTRLIEQSDLCQEDQALIEAYIKIPEQKKRVFRECLAALCPGMGKDVQE